jgi:ATP/maltotriose-dependent transcriptional regulator MalT
MHSPGGGQWPLVDRVEQLEQFDAALGDERCRVVIIRGPAGVGKSRLGEELLSHAIRRGHRGDRAVASAAAATIPLGAMAHLLPTEVATADAVAVFAAAAGRFHGPAKDRRYVLLVDDLHLLDPTSATLLSQLVVRGRILLVGTVCDGWSVSAAVAALDRGDRVLRIALRNLGYAETEQLLSHALGGLVEGRSVRLLYDASEGNVLHLRELVLNGLSSATLTETDGQWRHRGVLTPTVRLAELIETFLSTVGPAERAAMETLAVAAPLELTLAHEQIDAATLELLEDRGLVQVRIDRRRRWVELAHSLYGEVLRAAVPPLRRRRLLLRQADLVQSTGARRAGDPQRIATWLLAATGYADPDLLVRAAALARYAHDYLNAARLASAVLSQREDFEALLFLGEAQFETGELEPATRSLGRAQALARTELERAFAVVAHDQVALYRTGLETEALRANGRARERIRDPAARDALLVDEAMVRAFSGDPSRAIELLADLDSMPDPRTRVFGALAKVAALTETGHPTKALALSDRAYPEHLAVDNPVVIAHPSFQLAPRAYALTEVGRLADAEAVARQGYDNAVATCAPRSRCWLAIQLGRVELLRGRPATAGRWFADADQVSATHEYVFPRALALAGRAVAEALQGCSCAVDETVAVLESLPKTNWARLHAQLALAWRAVAADDLSLARDLLLTGADEARTRRMVTVEAHLRSEAARLGGAGLVAARLSELASTCEGELVRARAAHARAWAADDADDLMSATATLEAVGATLMAAETAAAAADRFRRGGERRAAARAQHAAETLAAQCEGAHTPGLSGLESPSALTQRELQIARLAAQGLSSRLIAQRLFVSRRTIENHLQHSYRKLGVTTRGELAAVLDATRVSGRQETVPDGRGASCDGTCGARVRFVHPVLAVVTA